MQSNIVSIIFILSAVLAGGIGLLINYAEPYLPVLITRTYRYGKFSSNAHQPLLAKLEVPKRWFQHFYMYAAPASTYVLYLVVCKYLWNADTPKNVLWILNTFLGSSRQPLVSPESTLIGTFIFTLHCWKRFYETQYISVFNNTKMNVALYIIGFYHYTGSLLCIVGESKGFVEGSEGNFSWTRITYTQLICSMILLLSSYTQLRTNIVLSNLRKNKSGKVVSIGYKIPYGGLFDYVSGALQTTEIIIYIMLSLILWQSTIYHCVTIWVICNQVFTGLLTHKWYKDTFQNYPTTRKAVIPYIF